MGRFDGMKKIYLWAKSLRARKRGIEEATAEFDAIFFEKYKNEDREFRLSIYGEELKAYLKERGLI